MILLAFACKGSPPQPDSDSVKGMDYQGTVTISTAALGCADGPLEAQLSTEGVPDEAWLTLQDAGEEHPLRLQAVDHSGWWSMWRAELLPLSDYLPGTSTTVDCVSVGPWELAVVVDGAVVDACTQEDEC